ncbi:MAG TPA: cytochrome P450, partial [Xanthobacteraceae bacterium]|nr:cytochrome P450 [Xanthobacteraceae bacterium]
MNERAASSPLPFRDRRRPPAPVPLTGRLGPWRYYRALRTNPITSWRQEAYESAILVDRGPLGDVIVVNAPDAIRRVFLDNFGNYPKDRLQLEKLGPGLGRGLLTAEGEDWKFQRRTLAPLFQPQAVADYLPVMVGAVGEWLARFEIAATDGTIIDMAGEMTGLTYEIISRTVFSSELQTSPEAMRAAISHYFAVLGRIDLWDFLKIPSWLPRPAHWRARSSTRVFRNEVHRLLERRRARETASEKPRDIVTLLMQARDPETGSGLGEEVIHNNLVTFIGAGHETTANALGWALFLLSEFPWAYERLAREVDSVLNGNVPASQDIPKLVFTRMVIEEAMRLYPPVPFLSRQAIGSDRLGDVEVRRRSLVVIAPWVLHRHRLLWEEPDLFEPERFAPDRRALVPRFGYLPFGAGPRVCIGVGFAMQEALVALAMIVQRFRFRLIADAKVEPVAWITLRP